MTGPAGLLRFDGTNFINVIRQAGLESSYKDTPSVAANGKVWFGLSSGAGSYDGTNVVTYGRSHGLGLTEVYCTHVAQDGAVWFAGQGGASRFDGTNFVNFTTADGLPGERMIFVTSSPDVGALRSTVDGAGRTIPRHSSVTPRRMVWPPPREQFSLRMARYGLATTLHLISVPAQSLSRWAAVHHLRGDQSHHRPRLRRKPVMASCGFQRAMVV